MNQAMKRFEAADPHQVGGSKIFCRGDVNPGLGDRAMVPGDFLGRLWAHFGPARPRDNGFTYAIRDRLTGLGFEAYSGASGPAYGATGKAEDYRSLLELFEAELTRTEPVECSIDYQPDIDYGTGMCRLGVRSGKPFDEPVRAATKGPRGPKSARSYEDCLALARKAEKGYGLEAAWQSLLDKALPPPPATFTLNGATYDTDDSCAGFTISRAGTPVFLFDAGRGMEEIPARSIPFDPPLSAVATLWLDSFDRWYADEVKKRGAR